MKEDILKEVNRCLNCINKPCSKACPFHNDIPLFISEVKNKNYKSAYEVLSKTTLMPSICGRVCPHSSLCEGSCVRGIKGEPIKIGKIESYIGDLGIKNKWYKENTCDENILGRVAVVGSGPASISCASILSKNGILVDIYEKHNYLGGILSHGIPSFRLSKSVVDNVINSLFNDNVNVYYNRELGRDLTLDYLKSKYDAVFIGIGANKPVKPLISSLNLDGVYYANSLLEYNKHPDYKNKVVVIVGGGNVAIDTARIVKRYNPSDVIVIYRRSEKEMSASKKEILLAENEGIKFLFQTDVVSINGDNKVSSIELVKTKLVKKEDSDRLYPVNILDSNYNFSCDIVIFAIGSSVDDVVNKLGLELDSNSKILVDDNFKTSVDGVFTGGDVTSSKLLVSYASKSGILAGYNIISYLRGKK